MGTTCVSMLGSAAGVVVPVLMPSLPLVDRTKAALARRYGVAMGVAFLLPGAFIEHMAQLVGLDPLHPSWRAGALGGLSCSGGACRGYELLADLAFDTNGSGGPDAGDAYWNGGSGWLPVGTAAEPFETTFEGNGREIRHLFIEGGAGAGLFGATGLSSVVGRVGLIAVDVTGTHTVGGLAGLNGGLVTSSWTTGRVSGAEAVGGLVGSNAGDVGGS